MSVRIEETAGLNRWQRYPAYRDSGVDWLGEIPAHWDVKRLKFIAESINDQRTTIEADEIYIQLENIESWTGKYVPSSDETTFEGTVKAFRPGDVLFNKLRPYLAKLILAADAGVCVSELIVLRIRQNVLLPTYLAKSLLSQDIISIVDSSTYGAKMPRASWGFIGNVGIPYPPDHAEQRAIAAFLDRKTGEIDALIAKKRELITRLQEQRSAIISHAVTRGLNPDAPMKDSGIEWLGEIPTHWESPKLKWVARLESGHTPSRQVPEYWLNCTIPWVSLADVHSFRADNREVIFETEELISELGLANSAARLLPTNTVILSRTASVGFSVILGQPMATTQDFVNWICTDRLHPFYLLYVFRSMRGEFRRLTMGSTHQTIYMPDVARFSIPLPPISEQIVIVDHIRNSTKSTDALIAKAEETISRLQEYRAALISAAVTGRIDVREEV